MRERNSERRYPMPGGGFVRGNGASDSPSDYADEHERAMHDDNERKLQSLSSKVSAIRELTNQIHSASVSARRDADDLEADMGGARATLGSAAERLKGLFRVGSSCHMLYLVLFVFFVFFLLYFLVFRRR
eukprot:m51a1_g7341 putative C-tail anchored protein (130) ;mRNA; f:205291-205799